MLPNKLLMTNFSRLVISQYIERDVIGKWDLFKLRNDLNIFPGFNSSVATVIELMCLAALCESGVGPLISRKSIRSPIYAALISIGAERRFWNIEGNVKQVSEYERILFDENLTKRRSNIQELFGIQSRDAFRYLCIGKGGACSLGDDMPIAFSELKSHAAVVLDAFTISQKIKDSYNGHLFTINL